MTAYQTGPLLPEKWYVSESKVGSGDGTRTHEETFNHEEAAKAVLSPPFDSEREARDWARGSSERLPQFFVWQFTEKTSPAISVD